MTFYGSGPDPIEMPIDPPKNYRDTSETISALWLAVVTLERKVKELEETVEYISQRAVYR